MPKTFLFWRLSAAPPKPFETNQPPSASLKWRGGGKPFAGIYRSKFRIFRIRATILPPAAFYRPFICKKFNTAGTRTRGNPPSNSMNMPFSLKATPRRRPEKSVYPAAKTCRANAFYIPARNNRTDNFAAEFNICRNTETFFDTPQNPRPQKFRLYKKFSAEV